MTFVRFLSAARRNCWAILLFGTIPLAGGELTALAAIAAEPEVAVDDAETNELREELKRVPYKIVFESYHDDHWGLKMVDADGSNAVSLTKSDVNELYPHVSPDGKKICYLVDEGKDAAKSRNIYYRNMDGTDQQLLINNGRDMCWNAEGTAIMYVKAELTEFTNLDYASKGLFRYDLATKEHQQHLNHDLLHLYNLCCSVDGKWFISTIHAALGFGHGNVSIEANGNGVYDLGIPGCRPDISHDGKRIAWGATDCELRVGDLTFSDGKPAVVHVRTILTSRKPTHIYHIDWSPDGKYVAFSRGPTKRSMGLPPEFIGVKAPGWNICVADASKQNCWVAITSDGQSNKEPDWVPLAENAK